MYHRTVEGFLALYSLLMRSVEYPRARKQDTASADEFSPRVDVKQSDDPFLIIILPSRFYTLGTEQSLILQAVRGCNIFQILLDLVVRR